MNRAELFRRLCSEASVPVSASASSVGQTGELGRLANWIDTAWEEIQAGHAWDFLWEDASVTVLANTNETAGTIPAHRYVQDSAYSGTMPMDYMPWEQFRKRWPSPFIVEGTPLCWSIRPDKAFVVNAKPTADTAYTVERYMNPVPMVADTDTPALAAEHHLVIVWRALMLYAQFEEAGSLYQTASVNFNLKMQALGLLETPDWSFGPALC